MSEVSAVVREWSGVDPIKTIELMHRWLAKVLAAPELHWLQSEIEQQNTSLDERRLGIAIGLAGRKVGRHELALPPEEIAAAEAWRAGWQPQFWRSDEAARIALLLATHHGDDQAFATRTDKLCVTAEINEHISYLKGFSIFPASKALHARAREGVRSSTLPIFQAIACRNPYPFDYFDQVAWNQMVVKCVFVGAPIDTIVGLRARRNPELLDMLRDFVAERHAAGRPLPDAVYRFIEK
jgi:hypothetical protein